MWNMGSPWLQNHDDDSPIARRGLDEELKVLTDAFNARVAGSPAPQPSAE